MSTTERLEQLVRELRQRRAELAALAARYPTRTTTRQETTR